MPSATSKTCHHQKNQVDFKEYFFEQRGQRLDPHVSGSANARQLRWIWFPYSRLILDWIFDYLIPDVLSDTLYLMGSSKILFIAFMLVLRTLVYASTNHPDCPETDFSKYFGTNRGSGGANMCWANTTADIIGYLQGVKPPDRISAIDVASSLFSVTSTQIAELAQNKLGSDQFLKNNLVGLNKAVLNFQNQFYKDGFNFARANPAPAIYTYQIRKGYCLESQLTISSTEKDHYIREYVNSIKIKLGGNPSPNDCKSKDETEKLQNFQYAMNTEILKTIENDLDHDCQPRKHMRPMTIKGLNIREDSRYRNADQIIADLLNTNGPIIANIASGVIFGTPYMPDADHSVLVVGSHWNDQVKPAHCEFKVRTGYSDCEKFDTNLRHRCKEGVLLLNQDEINGSTESVVTAELTK